MKERSSKILVCIMLVAVMMSLSACSLLKFDAAGYVKAVLDASTKAEFKEYVKFTKSTEKEAQAGFDALMDSYMSELNSVNVSEGLKENYRQLYTDMLAKTKYTVGEATKNGDTYTVEVSVEPLNMFEGYQDEVNTATTNFQNELTADYEASGAMPNEDEIQERYYTLIYNLMKSRLNGATYGPEQKVVVSVIKNADGYYEIESASFDSVITLLISVEES